jgi:hypothetical protein
MHLYLSSFLLGNEAETLPSLTKRRRARRGPTLRGAHLVDTLDARAPGFIANRLPFVALRDGEAIISTA